MIGAGPADKPLKPVFIDVVLADGFSMLTTTLIVEALRFVNLAHRAKVFDWRIKGIQSDAPRASNGFTLSSQLKFDSDTPPADVVFLNASYFPDQANSPRLLAWLRTAARHGAWVLAVDTAPILLAEAGLLDGKPATVHWEEFESAKERFGRVEFRPSGVEQAGRLMTCSGGMAVLDMMLAFIGEFQGESIAKFVKQCFFLKDAETSLVIRNKKLSTAVQVMRHHIALPVSLAKIAALSNLSLRQLHREFEAEFAVSPGRFYIALRMQKAQSLLINTDMPVSKIGFECGYANVSWFGKAYRAFYNITPHEERARMALGKEKAENRLSMFFQPSSTLLVSVSGKSITP